jgi:hypothetical protein
MPSLETTTNSMTERTHIATALDPTRLFPAAGIGSVDPWQRRVLLGPWSRLLMLCSRQAGKSTTVAALAAHTALYTPESLTLITAPSQRQAKETLGKFWSFYQAIGRPTRVAAKSELRVRFENGSRVIALPGTEKTIRGYSAVDLLILDEAARIEDALYDAVRPMLAVSRSTGGGGRLAALTTPWGKRGWFYEAWTDDSQDWERIKITANDCPRITEDFLAQERDELGSWRFQQEYLCQFTDTEDQFFRTDAIEAAASHDFAPLFGPDAEPQEDDPESDSESDSESDDFAPLPITFDI